MNQTRILLVDDHALFREGLAGIISAQPDFIVIGEASDGLEAQVKAQKLQPDLVLMDIEMPGCDGLEATKEIKANLPQTPIVMLTVRDDEDKLFEAIRNGAQGYLLKSMASKEILALLRGAVQGQIAISPLLAGHMLTEFRRLSQKTPPTTNIKSETEALTHREHEVLALVATGSMDKEIADELAISLHTVKSHMRNILAKLHVSNRSEAAQQGREQGLV